MEYTEAEGDWLNNPEMLRMMCGQLLLVFFYILVVVVMLNLLIAIMGNAYAEIAQNEKVEMQLARAQAILYIERNILFQFMKDWDMLFPRYLHVLQPHKGEEGIDDTQSTSEGRIEAHFDQKMKLMQDEIEKMSNRMNDKMKNMMTLLGAGVLIERKDHPHKLRHVAYKNWAHTIPLWRCSTCATDYSSSDKMLSQIEPSVFVCNEHYESMMIRDDDDEEWSPPTGCDFALCAKCVRNQEPLPTAKSKQKSITARNIERVEAATVAETKREEDALDAELIVAAVPEMSTEMTLDMLEADDNDAAGSMEDMYAMLND